MLLSDFYKQLRGAATQEEADVFISQCLAKEAESFPRAFLAKSLCLHRGKVRELYRVSESEMYIYCSDRLSAFDRSYGDLPFRGVILAAMNRFFSEVLKKHGFAMTLLKVIDPRTDLVRRCHPLPVEVVVRAYLAGSMADEYERGRRSFFSQKLPEGMRRYDLLPEVMLTPTTKAGVYEKDLPLERSEIFERHLCQPKDWEEIEVLAKRTFAFGQSEWARCGYTLVDTKYEVAKTEQGWGLIDEVHTPDSSRLWEDSGGHSFFDKEYLRGWIKEAEARGERVQGLPYKVLAEAGLRYLKVAEALIGCPLSIPEGAQDAV